MQLVYGVLRKRQNLDRIIELLSKTPIAKLNPFVHQALAVALFQLFFLQRIPVSAAVNEAVESCKAKGIHKRLHGFVNGVLRQALRQKVDLEKKMTTDKRGRLIVNHPQWLVSKWQKQFGKTETETICTCNNSKRNTTIRINTNRIDIETFSSRLESTGVVFNKGMYADDALILIDLQGPVHLLPGYEAGEFTVQGEAAQLATTLLAPFKKGGRYLDGCAGIGGKSTHLLQFAEDNQMSVHAVEPDQYRFGKLRENLARLHPELPEDRFNCQQSGLQQLDPQKQSLFDGVLLDVPCSGTGVISSNPDIRWNRAPGDILRYQELQLSLLGHAAQLVKPGGLLVYVTCSIEPEENQEVISHFLENHKGFDLTDCSQHLPLEAKQFVHDSFFRPLPTPNIEGFFAARLRRL